MGEDLEELNRENGSIRLWRGSKSWNKGREHNYPPSQGTQRVGEDKGEGDTARQRERAEGGERKRIRESQRESYSSVRLEFEMFRGRIIFLPPPLSATHGFRDGAYTLFRYASVYTFHAVTSVLRSRN